MCLDLLPDEEGYMLGLAAVGQQCCQAEFSTISPVCIKKIRRRAGGRLEKTAFDAALGTMGT